MSGYLPISLGWRLFSHIVLLNIKNLDYVSPCTVIRSIRRFFFFIKRYDRFNWDDYLRSVFCLGDDGSCEMRFFCLWMTFRKVFFFLRPWMKIQKVFVEGITV